MLFVLNDPATGKEWKLGRVIQVEERKLTIVHTKKETQDGIPRMKFLKRSMRDVAIIIADSELPLNSRDYYEKITNTYNV